MVRPAPHSIAEEESLVGRVVERKSRTSSKAKAIVLAGSICLLAAVGVCTYQLQSHSEHLVDQPTPELKLEAPLEPSVDEPNLRHSDPQPLTAGDDAGASTSTSDDPTFNFDSSTTDDDFSVDTASIDESTVDTGAADASIYDSSVGTPIINESVDTGAADTSSNEYQDGEQDITLEGGDNENNDEGPPKFSELDKNADGKVEESEVLDFFEVEKERVTKEATQEAPVEVAQHIVNHINKHFANIQACIIKEWKGVDEAGTGAINEVQFHELVKIVEDNCTPEESGKPGPEGEKDEIKDTTFDSIDDSAIDVDIGDTSSIDVPTAEDTGVVIDTSSIDTPDLDTASIDIPTAEDTGVVIDTSSIDTPDLDTASIDIPTSADTGVVIDTSSIDTPDLDTASIDIPTSADTGVVDSLDLDTGVVDETHNHGHQHGGAQETTLESKDKKEDGPPRFSELDKNADGKVNEGEILDFLAAEKMRAVEKETQKAPAEAKPQIISHINKHFDAIRDCIIKEWNGLDKADEGAIDEGQFHQLVKNVEAKCIPEHAKNDTEDSSEDANEDDDSSKDDSKDEDDDSNKDDSNDEDDDSSKDDSKDEDEDSSKDDSKDEDEDSSKDDSKDEDDDSSEDDSKDEDDDSSKDDSGEVEQSESDKKSDAPAFSDLDKNSDGKVEEAEVFNFLNEKKKEVVDKITADLPASEVEAATKHITAHFLHLEGCIAKEWNKVVSSEDDENAEADPAIDEEEFDLLVKMVETQCLADKKKAPQLFF